MTAPLLVEVSVPGLPRTQGSHKWVTSRSTGRAVPKGDEAARAHRSKIAGALRAVWLPRPALDAPVHLSAVFGFPRPASHVGKRGGLLAGAPRLHSVKPDTDKLLRLVGDALTEARVLSDDSRIVSVAAAKVWLPVGAVGLTLLRVTAADAGALADPVGALT